MISQEGYRFQWINLGEKKIKEMFTWHGHYRVWRHGGQHNWDYSNRNTKDKSRKGFGHRTLKTAMTRNHGPDFFMGFTNAFLKLWRFLLNVKE